MIHTEVFFQDGRYKVTMAGEPFRSVCELIDNYMRSIMYQANGEPVPLLKVMILGRSDEMLIPKFQPLQSTRVLPCMIEERLEFLKKLSPKNSNKDNAAEEFDVSFSPSSPFKGLTFRCFKRIQNLACLFPVKKVENPKTSFETDTKISYHSTIRG